MKIKEIRNVLLKLVSGFLVFQSVFVYFLALPVRVDRAALTNASGTLSNSRRSFYADVNGAHAAADTSIAIKSSGNTGPDTTVAGLFPGDSVSVGPNPSLTVSSIPSTTGQNFILTTGIPVGASDGVAVYGTQSGTLTLAFTIGSTIPASGTVLVTIPDPASNGNDGGPDTAATTALNGFDLNNMAAANVSTTGGTGCTWNATETITPGGGSGHTIEATTTTACTGGTITMVIGTTVGLINPARVAGTSLGVADVYQIGITSKDATGGNTIESTEVSVAVQEGVLVSATVDETLSFTVAGLSTPTACGVVSTLTTTATTVPWGTLPTTYAAGNHNTAQQLTISTNALNGYKVYGEENDQMGKDGNVCTGATPSAGEYTFSAGTCIRDTVCDGTGCSHTTYRDWAADPTTFYGLGYSLDNVTNTDATFEYNTAAANFNAKTFADQEASESRADSNAHLMTNAGPVSGSSAYVCYRIHIPGSQPAGYYYNKVKYTAVATF